jgi:hypothetical protein
LLQTICHVVRAIAVARARIAVGASTVNPRFFTVDFTVITSWADLAVRTSTIDLSIVFQAIGEPITTQFWTRWAIGTTAVNADFSWILDAVEVGRTRLTVDAAIHPLLSMTTPIIYPFGV